MGAAKDSSACAETIIGQISSVGEMAINIATFGSAKAATAGATSAAKASRLAKLKSQFVKMKNFFKNSDGVKKMLKKAADKAKEVAKDPEAMKDTAEKLVDLTQKSQALAESDPDKMTAADYVRMSAEIAGIFDPTGAASVVASFSHPKCNEIF